MNAFPAQLTALITASVLIAGCVVRRDQRNLTEAWRVATGFGV